MERQRRREIRKCEFHGAFSFVGRKKNYVFNNGFKQLPYFDERIRRGLCKNGN